jgi:ABC-type nitrate/sulfonate/bicarbonate transport system ATPase subunit
LNDAHPAGAFAPLDVRVARKAYLAASGERLEVLHDIAFTLRPGEVGAIVGPSGCGKTTMLRIIAGLDHDYHGAIVRPPDGKLGMVFQEPRLLPWRTVEDNVRLVAPAIAATDLATLFDVLGLAGHRAHYPGELSLGLARRVALARAFAVKPELLLLDEPFVSLDQALAARLRQELVMLVDRYAVITLLVTHNLDEAIELADRLILLSARPARILAEMPLSAPRRFRTAAEAASIKAQVADRLAAVGESAILAST